VSLAEAAVTWHPIGELHLASAAEESAGFYFQPLTGSYLKVLKFEPCLEISRFFSPPRNNSFREDLSSKFCKASKIVTDIYSLS